MLAAEESPATVLHGEVSTPARGRGSEATLAVAAAWLVVFALAVQMFTQLVSAPVDGEFAHRGLLLGGWAGAMLTFGRFYRAQLAGGRATLAGWTCVVLALGLLVAGAWSLAGVALAVLLLMLPARWGWGACVAATVAIAIVAEREASNPATAVVVPVVAWLVGVILYSLTRLAIVLGELRRAREALTRMQVDAERHRISRDLHDIMGRTLATASLRNEAALRLIDTDRARATEQLLQVQSILSGSQQQLRQIVSGPVLANFGGEVEAASDLCERLHITCEVSIDSPVEAPFEMLAGAVLREAITNMLKHGTPKRCWITTRDESEAVTLSITNDGCPPAGTHAAGTGLRDMKHRAELAGATLEAARVGSDRFRLVLRMPRSAAPTP